MISNERHTFLTDFRQIDFPRHLGVLLGIDSRAMRLLLRRLYRTRLLEGWATFGNSCGLTLFCHTILLGVSTLALAAAALALVPLTRLLGTCGCRLWLRPVFRCGMLHAFRAFLSRHYRWLHYRIGWSLYRSSLLFHRLYLGCLFGAGIGNSANLCRGFSSSRLGRFDGGGFVTHVAEK